MLGPVLRRQTTGWPVSRATASSPSSTPLACMSISTRRPAWPHPPARSARTRGPARAPRLRSAPGGDPVDRRALAQKLGECGRAVGGVGIRSQSDDRMSRLGAGTLVVGVIPQPELEIDPAAFGLVADEAQRLEVALPLFRRETFLALHVIAGHIEQKRVGEAEVIVRRRMMAVVVLHPEPELEAVDPVGGELGEVVRPEVAVVEPRGVLLDRDEDPQDAAHRRRRALGQRLGRGQLGHRIGRVGRPVGEFQYRRSRAHAHRHPSRRSGRSGRSAGRR